MSKEFGGGLRSAVRDGVAIARREGVPLESFLRTYWSNLPATLDDDGRVFVCGLVCVEWFKDESL